jgi:glycosyltransferase involved in cell wall biosynthesis
VETYVGRGPLVSCIIPTYRRTETLRRALNSMLRQSYDNIEVLVIDDNELDSDATSFVSDIVCTVKDSRVRLIRPGRHCNGAIARNAGIENARGDLIAFLDDDDEWCRTKLAAQVTHLVSDATSVGASCWRYVLRGGRLQSYGRQPTLQPTKLDLLTRRVDLNTGSLVIRRSAFDRGLRFDGQLRRHQDIQLALDALDYGPIRILPQYLMRVHVDDGQHRPTYSDLRRIKADFLRSASVHLSEQTPLNQRRIRSCHAYELAYVAARERRLWGVVRSLSISGVSLTSMFDLGLRINLRMSGRRMAKASAGISEARPIVGGLCE